MSHERLPYMNATSVHFPTRIIEETVKTKKKKNKDDSNSQAAVTPLKRRVTGLGQGALGGPNERAPHSDTRSWQREQTRRIMIYKQSSIDSRQGAGPQAI